MFKKMNYYVLLVSIVISNTAHSALPPLKIEGVDTSSNDPVKMVGQIAGAVFTMGITILLGFFAFTIIKNGYQKYNETGEDGSRTQLKDAVINMSIGAVLLVAGIILAGWGTATFA